MEAVRTSRVGPTRTSGVAIGAGANAPTLAAGGGSPVHSSHLTADYFPGALRTPENRAATVTPEAAAAAIRAGRHRGDRL